MYTSSWYSNWEVNGEKECRMNPPEAENWIESKALKLFIFMLFIYSRFPFFLSLPKAFHSLRRQLSLDLLS